MAADRPIRMVVSAGAAGRRLDQLHRLSGKCRGCAFLHTLLALQALAGPVVFHILQRPLIERLPGVELDLDPEVAVTEIAHHWLRAMRTEAP